MYLIKRNMEYICNENVLYAQIDKFLFQGLYKNHPRLQNSPFSVSVANFDSIPPMKISAGLIRLHPFILYKFHTSQHMKTLLLQKKRLTFVFTFIKIMSQINHLLCHPVHCSKILKFVPTC